MIARTVMWTVRILMLLAFMVLLGWLIGFIEGIS